MSSLARDKIGGLAPTLQQQRDWGFRVRPSEKEASRIRSFGSLDFVGRHPATGTRPGAHPETEAAPGAALSNQRGVAEEEALIERAGSMALRQIAPPWFLSVVAATGQRSHNVRLTETSDCDVLESVAIGVDWPHKERSVTLL